MSQQSTVAAELEARRQKRYSLSHPVKVTDIFTGTEIGNLVNVTPDGMMLVSTQPFEPNRIYQIELKLPDTILGSDCIQVVIDCLWTKRAKEEAVYWAGCAIIDADEQASAIIEALIETYGE